MAVTEYTNDPADIDERVRRVIRVKSSADLTEVVDAALMLIVGLAQPAGYSQFEMQKLHTYLSAHLYEVDYQRKFRQKIGKSEEYPETKIGLGLDLTRPGQQVRVLDYKHAFAAVDDDNQSLRPARMFWAGNPREAH